MLQVCTFQIWQYLYIADFGRYLHSQILSFKEFYRIESELPEFACKLPAKALQPSNLERQNVCVVLQILSDFVSHAIFELVKSLKSLLRMHDYSELVKIIVWESTNILLNKLCFEKKQ